MQRSRVSGSLLALFCQGDVDGRIIFDGFATAKNFGDWILNFSGAPRQVKMTPKKIGCILMKRRALWVLHFSTAKARTAKHPRFGPIGLHVNGTKLGHLAVLNTGRNGRFSVVGKM
jgi:hypothetical protein